MKTKEVKKIKKKKLINLSNYNSDKLKIKNLKHYIW